MAVFETTDEATALNPFETLVGEGKRYKTPADLATGKLEADRTIADRERENRELREELDRRLAVEEQIKQFATREPVSPPVGAQPNQNVAATPKEISEDDLVRRIREIKHQDDVEQIRAKNLEFVANQLINEFGDEDKAHQVLATKASELGVSVKFLQESAAQSPKAFFATLGLKPAESPPQASRGVINTEAFVSTSAQAAVKPGTYAYFDQIRKTNPALYFSVPMQAQIHKAAAEASAKGVPFYPT